MLRLLNLSIPKTGTSRFSKALPNVPGQLDEDEEETRDSSLPSSSQSSSFSPLKKLRSLQSDQRTRATTEKGTNKPRTATGEASRAHSNWSPNPNPNPTTLDFDGSNFYDNNIFVSTSIVRKPLESAPSRGSPPPSPPLPPPPPSETLSTAESTITTATTAAMAIPRKPIANNTLQLPALSPLYLQQPSPTDTLASLLSAYIRDPDEDFGKSSYETTPASSHGFEESPSQAVQKPLAAPPRSNARAPAAALPSTVKNGSGSLPPRPNPGAAQHQRRPVNEIPPPPPSKDDRDLNSTTTSSSPSSATITDLAAPTSPRPEIWKRRPHMSQNSRELPGLKLDYSHGSTADTQPVSDSDPAPGGPSPPPPAPPSGSTKPTAPRAPPFAGGLPGRNVRPSLRKKDQPPPAAQKMGNETSKLKHIRDKLSISQRSGSISSTASSKHGLPGRPAAQRPPTPEYQREDIKESVIEPFITPVSPASSTEAPRGAVSPDFSKELPPQPLKKGPKESSLPQNPVPRKALPSIPGRDLTAVGGLPQQPKLKSDNSNAYSGSVPSTQGSTVQTTRGPSPPNDNASTRSRVSEERPSVQPQNQSSVQNAQKAVQPSRPPQTTADPRLLQSDTQGLLYRGRDGTLYPEMKAEREPHPKASYFPMQTYTSSTKDGILKAKPLHGSHFNCFQNHQTMQRRGNKNCPLACQTCERADLEDRWACTFCNLRICDACFRKLNTCQKDLHRLMDNLANNAPLMLSSQSRPGTALGLQSV